MASSKSRLGRGLSGLISGGMRTPAKETPVTKKAAPAKETPVTKKAFAKPTPKAKKPPAPARSKKESSPPAPPAPVEAASHLPGFQEIPLRQVTTSPYQPRREFDEDSLRELAESIRSEGLLQPIVVRVKGEHYELIAGERRWRAGQMLRLTTITARVMEASDASAASLALIENLQREGLDPIEEALGYASLIRDFDLTQEAVAERVGKARASVANALRLLQLSPALQGFVSKGMLSMGHAKVLLGVEDREVREMLARRVIEAGLSVRALEKLVASQRSTPPLNGTGAIPREKTALPEHTAIKALEKNLTSHFQSPVHLKHQGKKGKLIIAYRGNDDLHRILEKMGVTLN